MIKKDIMKSIHSLDESSSSEEIKSIIEYDIKKEVVTKETINKIKSYPEITKELFLEDNVNDINNNIKNWLRYKILANISKRVDCDTTDLVGKFLCNLYEVEKIKGKNLRKDRRHYKKDDVLFESDNINSYATIFGIYIRNILKEKGLKEGSINSNISDKEVWQEYYKKDFKISSSNKKNTIHKYYWTLKNIDKLRDYCNNSENKELHEEIWNNLNRFALLTNSIFNFNVVPFCFNTYRTKVNDYWDLSLELLKDNRKEELAKDIYQKSKNKNKDKKEIFKSLETYSNGKIDTSCDGVYIKRNFEYPKVYPLKCNQETYELINETIKKMINEILIRSIKVLTKLNTKLKKNESEIIDEILANNKYNTKNNKFGLKVAKIVIDNLQERKKTICNPIYYYSKYPKVYNLINMILEQTRNNHQVKYISVKKINDVDDYSNLDLLIIGNLNDIVEDSELENKLNKIINIMKKEEKQIIVVGTKKLEELNLSPKLYSIINSGLTIEIE